MSVSSARRRLASAAVLATSLMAATACASTNTPTASSTPANQTSSTLTTGTAPSASAATTVAAPAAPAVNWAEGMAVVSDGTDTVQIGGTPVKFPSTVQDAAFSPDGSKLAFVDADGNVDTTRADGSSRTVLTKADTAVKRAHPAWFGSTVVWEEKAANGTLTIEMLGTPGPAGAAAGADPTAEQAFNMDRGGDPATSAKGSSAPESGAATLVYQRKGAKGPEVWIVDHNERSGDTSRKVADGSQPAVSPDGKTVAFVAANGAVDIEDATWYSGSGKPQPKPKPIATGVTGPTHLTWTPDGKSVAFSTAADIERVPATGASGGTTTPTQISAKPGVVTFLPQAIDTIDHVTGSDLVTQAIAAAQTRWGTQTETSSPAGGGGGWPTATGVVLASSDDPSSAMIGAWMSGPRLASLLLTPKAALDPKTAAEIKRELGAEPASNKTPDPTTGAYYLDNVYIVGDTSVISQAVEDSVRQLGYHVVRIKAADQYAMAVAAQKIPYAPLSNSAPPESLVVVSADDPAVEAVTLALTPGLAGSAMLLTDGANVPDADKAVLNSLSGTTTIYTVGAKAQAALASNWAGKPGSLSVKPISGTTSAEISAAYTTLGISGGTWGAAKVVVAPTGSPQDALIGETLAVEFASRLVFVDPSTGLDAATTASLDAGSVVLDTAFFVDHATVIGKDVESKIGALIGGPLGAPSEENQPVSPM